MILAFYGIVILYSLVLSFLLIYGFNMLTLSYLARRFRGADPASPPLTDYPSVTVQIPIYNELYVARRIIEAVCQLDWPRERLDIQVLDDSTDQTVEIVAEIVQHYQGKGINIVHLRRSHRTGYKAGALAAGLAQARGEFIAIFDADFLPAPTFLKQTIPHFANRAVGFVQTRWGHLNRDYSLLTRLQSIAIDAHFVIEQFVRHRAGYLMNFNGTAGVWRRQAIEDAGGWSSSTLTEDLDLSYRAQLAGWQPCYLRDVITPAEVPVTVNGFRRQQSRWARGTIQCALTLIPHILRAPLPVMSKFQGIMHLMGYGIQLLMMLLVLLYPPLLLLGWHTDRATVSAVLTGLTLAAFIGPGVYLFMGQHEIGRPWNRQIPYIVLLCVLAAGMVYHNTYAMVSTWVDRKPAVFERTPKFGITTRQQTWSEKMYALKANPGMVFEVGMLVFNLNTVRLGLEHHSLPTALYAAFFALGLAFVLGITMTQDLKHHARRSTLAGRRKTPVEEQGEVVG